MSILCLGFGSRVLVYADEVVSRILVPFTSIATGSRRSLSVLLCVRISPARPATPPPPVLLDRTGGRSLCRRSAARRAVRGERVRHQDHEKTPALFDDPVFRRFFGDQASRPRFKRENSLGSGVIVDSSGYILTNNRVIRASSEIQVVLGDGSLPARIVGSDPGSRYRRSGKPPAVASPWPAWPPATTMSRSVTW